MANASEDQKVNESAQNNDAALLKEEHRNERKIVIGAIAAIVVVAIAFFTVYKVIDYRRDLHTASMLTCSTNYANATESEQDMKETLADAKQRAAYSSSDVADPNTLNDLAEAISRVDSLPDKPECSPESSTDALMNTADLLTIYNDDVINTTAALRYAAKAVQASHLELQNIQQ